MRRLLRLACIAAALALATGAAAVAEAPGAGDGGASAASVAAQDRARKLRLEEARMQVEAARMALDRAREMVKKGLTTEADAMERELDLVRAERALAEVEAMAGRRTSVQLQDATLQEAFAAIFRDSDESFMLHPDLAGLPYSITLALKNVNVESAVQMICKLYNLEYETDNEGLWVIMPGSGFATVGGSRVPIIGTVTTVQGSRSGETELAPRDIRVFTGGRGGGGMGLIETPKRPSFLGENRLVDLDVKDAPLSEVASRLSFKADALPKEGPLPSGWPDTYCDLEVIADDAVKDLKVTAKIAKWPLGEVVDMLLAQTGLVCTVDPATGTPGAGRGGGPPLQIRRDPVTGELVYPPPPAIRVYLVPAPELRVAGAGLPSLPLWPRLQSTREQWAPDAEVAQLYAKLGQLQADEVTVLHVLRECPKCHAAAILPDWKYCPKCGAKLPEVKQPAEKGAKGE